jgi:ubiquitin-protein ligase
MKGRVLAMKRINKDIKEIIQFPIEGIGIAPLDNDGMKYVANIRLMTGLYAGYCVQLLLTFSDNYPSKPPKILIYPGQAIDGQYHHHIFYDNTKDNTGLRFKKFCFDLLDNDFMNTNVERSGWNPSYSISSLLLQVQNFIGDPDLPKEHLPNKDKIEELMQSMNNYERIFEIEEGNDIRKIKHTWKNPFPEMHIKKQENEIIDINKKKEDVRIQQIKENLTCFMLKLNYIDDPEILLGYPIIQKKGKGKEKIELFPIPELLTYDGYIAQIQKQEEKLDFYFDTKFKSANNQFYNYWMPIYIDEKHYSKNKTTILNALSVIKYGPLGIKKHDFQTEQIFEILPIILNKMIIGMFNGQSIISSAFIMCYFHYILLFKKLCNEYENEYIKYLNNKMNMLHRCKYNIKKKIIPDIGNFLVLLFFCHKKINNKYLKKMWNSLYEEFLLRQIFWMFFNEGRGDKILNKIILTEEEMGISDKINELKKSSLKSGYLKIKDNAKFIELLNKKKLYDKIIEIINKVDESDIIGLLSKKKNNSKNNKKKIMENMDQNFNEVFESLEANKKRKIINVLIDQEELYECFGLSDIYIKKKIAPKKERILKIKKLLYNSDKINDEIKNEFLKYAFDSQIGNKLLLITFIAKKTIDENEFMEQLEKNYGVYLDVDNFIKKMKTKLNEIKTYKQLFEYLESDFGKNKTNLEIIKDAYEKAKFKGYIERDKIKKKKVNKDNNTKKEKKEKKATVNFDDDENEEYIEDYSDDDNDYDEDEEEGEEGEEGEEEEDE